MSMLGNANALMETGSCVFLPFGPSPLTQTVMHTCGFWLQSGITGHDFQNATLYSLPKLPEDEK